MGSTGEEMDEALSGITIDIKDGVHHTFFPSGLIATECEWRSGRRVGRFREWYDNGCIKEDGEVDDEGEIHGSVLVWNRKGELLGTYVLSHGLGTIKKWSEEGVLELEMEILPHGLMRGLFPNERRKPLFVYLHNGKPISKKKFLMIRERYPTGRHRVGPTMLFEAASIKMRHALRLIMEGKQSEKVILLLEEATDLFALEDRNMALKALSELIREIRKLGDKAYEHRISEKYKTLQ